MPWWRPDRSSRGTWRPAPSCWDNPPRPGGRFRWNSCSRTRVGATREPQENEMSPTPTKAAMQVPLLDLRAQYNDIRADIDDAVRRVMESTRFIGGPEVSGLEEEVARYSQSPHGIACASGTDALLLSLRALGVGPGDEVVTSAYSFFASAGTIANAGGTPVFVDVDPRTYNLDAHRLEA